MSENRNVLVIVGRSVAGAELVGALVPRAGEGIGFTLLLPATPLPCAKGSPYVPKEQGSEEADWVAAAKHAEEASAALRGAGLEVIESIVGDADFAAAAGDVLHSREIDDVVVLVDPGAALGVSPDLVAV